MNCSDKNYQYILKALSPLTNFHFSGDRTFEHSDEAQATNYEFWLNLVIQFIMLV